MLSIFTGEGSGQTLQGDYKLFFLPDFNNSIGLSVHRYHKPFCYLIILKCRGKRFEPWCPDFDYIERLIVNYSEIEICISKCISLDLGTHSSFEVRS